MKKIILLMLIMAMPVLGAYYTYDPKGAYNENYASRDADSVLCFALGESDTAKWWSGGNVNMTRHLVGIYQVDSSVANQGSYHVIWWFFHGGETLQVEEIFEAKDTIPDVNLVHYEGADDVNAEIQSECADAITAYDPPTNTEMEARTLVAGSYFDFTTDEVDADIVKISGDGTAADNLEDIVDADSTVRGKLWLDQIFIQPVDVDDDAIYIKSNDEGIYINATGHAVQLISTGTGYEGFTTLGGPSGHGMCLEGGSGNTYGFYALGTTADIRADSIITTFDSTHFASNALDTEHFSTDFFAQWATLEEASDAVWGENDTTVVDSSKIGEWLATNIGGGSCPSAATIADAVWDEAVSGHTSGGSFGDSIITTEVHTVVFLSDSLADTTDIKAAVADTVASNLANTHGAGGWTTGGASNVFTQNGADSLSELANKLILQLANDTTQTALTRLDSIMLVIGKLMFDGTDSLVVSGDGITAGSGSDTASIRVMMEQLGVLRFAAGDVDSSDVTDSVLAMLRWIEENYDSIQAQEWAATAGTGTEACSVYIADASDFTALNRIKLTVGTGAQQQTVYSNASGYALANVDPGDWYWAVSDPPNTGDTGTYTAADGIVDTALITTATITAASGANQCKVYGYELLGADTLEGAIASLELMNVGSDTLLFYGNIGYGQGIHESEPADSTGKWEIIVIPNSILDAKSYYKFVLKHPALSENKSFNIAVPDTNLINIVDCEKKE